MRLTIGIPTYDRNEILAETVRHLLPQMTADCKLLILDNHCEVPVADTLAPLLKEHPAVNVEVIRNRWNVGSGANILRCFEYSDTDWLWVLGDDDTPEPDAIQKILGAVDAYPEARFLTFSWPRFQRPAPFTTRGLAEFVERMDDFGSVLFTSVGIFRASEMRRNLPYGYLACYAWGAHMGVLLTSIGEDGLCCYLTEQLIREDNRAPVGKRYGGLNLALCLPTLAELPMPSSVRRQLSLKIAAMIPFHYVVSLPVVHALRTGDIEEALFAYDHTFYRRGYFWRSPLRRLAIRMCRFLVRFPTLGRAAGTVYERLKGGQGDWMERYPNRWGNRV